LVAEVIAPDNQVEEVVPVPAQGQAAAVAAVAPMVMDPGMWLNMFNVKPPQLADIEIESMKKFILEHKSYFQKCSEQLCWRMQHFILEDHLDIIVDFGLHDQDEIMAQNRDDFIVKMLEMHQANSSSKWRLTMKNAKMEKQDLSLSTYTQYVDDFKFWMLTAGDAHKPPEKEIVKIFVVSSLISIGKKFIHVHVRGVINEAREELSTYREVFMEISERIKKSDLWIDSRDTPKSADLKSKKPTFHEFAIFQKFRNCIVGHFGINKTLDAMSMAGHE
jgi:hypothetical protein